MSRPKNNCACIIRIKPGPHALAVGDEQLQDFERGQVGPLQIVEDQHQRMLGTRHRANEILQHEVEAVLRLGRGQLRQLWLRPDQGVGGHG